MSAKSIGFATRILSVFLVLSLSMGPLGIIPARAAGILHVTPDGTGTCSDWVNACSLQTALTDAVSGDEIWVQAGLYKPTTDSDRSATFQLKSGVAVYGGFAGTESARSERDFATNVTTLSGDLSGNDNDTILPDEPTRAENSYHVVTGASNAILDGFTVTAGNANGATEGTDQGGGLYNIHSNTIIQNVIFSRNTAVSTGGGIYDYMSQPELERVTFINNWGSIGGGMFNHTSSPTLIDVTFSNNSSYMGGGMRNMYNSSPSLTRVTFSQNSANIGGGMNNYLDSNPILTDVIFTENTSTVEAGLGGGMHNSESAPILTNVTFDRNVAIYGGGIRNDMSNPTLINVTFSGNSAISGGGEYDDFSNPTILNSTFTGNSATDRGGGIFNTSLPFQIDNTIFWGNTAPNGGSQIMSYGGNIRNTVLQGGCPEGLTCTNIITADPKLGTLGDYGGFTPTIPLLAGSSAIDAGDDVACPTTDQRGISRPQGAHCDIGAYESQSSNVLYATPGGLTSGACSSWITACDLQYALTYAVSGQEIWVAAGTYKPTNGTDRAATFQLKSGVAVYGGFAGNESARSERDFATNITTLSGDLSGNDNDTILPDEPTRAENSYHVVTGASDAILDGFTVTAGNANGSPFPNDSGGGLLEFYSGSILTNILFLRNTTSTGGGGMFSLNSDTVLTDVTFRENNALYDGGGICSLASILTITRGIFDNNSAASTGGGMYALQENTSLTDVAFIGNTADMGGGLYNVSDGLMNNITFFDNSAVTYGGGMMNRGYVTLTNATFAGNSADNGGGFSDTSNRTSILTNVTFYENTANTHGGGIFNLSSYITIRNSILWGNTDLSGFQVYGDGESRISDSVLQGSCSIYSICTNIITADPLLGTLGDHGGFTQTIPIEEGSPAIDATSNNCPATDQRGLARSNPACDIGAYELQPSNVLYATPGGLTSGTCSSWAAACDLQYALINAVSGDEIWVAAGTYKPTDGTDRTATFQLKNGVAVYGGFRGKESACFERDFTVHVTTLSGDLLENDNDIILPDETTRTDNSYHVVTGASGAILDGFTVTAGNANELAFTNSRGGGLYNFQSNPAIQNVIFSSNTAHFGGGIHNYESQPQLANVMFVSNWAVMGGGMGNEYSSPNLMNVQFIDNSAQMGGGIRNDFSSSPTLTNATFTNNSAYHGGGLNNYHDCNPILISVVFNGNTARGDNNGSDGSGGAMLNVENSKPILVNVEFLNNMAAYGGGISNYNSSPTLTNVTFSKNSAWYGGGIYGTYYQYNHISELTNVTFTDNSVVDGYRAGIGYGYGGGIYNHGGNLNLLNVTFSSNTATDSGGGIYTSDSVLGLENVTLTNNSAGYSGGGIVNASSLIVIKNSILWQNTAPHGAQIYSTYSTPTISDSVVQGGYAGGTNIITDDPKLGTLGNYGGFTPTIPLLAGSSALDAGNDNTCTETDQRGVTRPQGLHCDIGAYEAIEDAIPPETSILSAPSAFDKESTPTFTFSGDDGVNSGISAFLCSVDGSPYTTCVSPHTLNTLSDGAHTFEVYALDLAGNADPSPATHAWTVETVAPQTSILTAPLALDNDNTPTFAFDGNDGAGSGVASFLCKVDNDAFAPCTSPFTSPALEDGPHSFEVYALDLAGNADPSPAAHAWTVETVAPQTSILTAPLALDNDNTPTFTFDGNDGAGSGVASFLCKVDNDAFAPCTSPFTSPALEDGPHSFEVYALDLAGNADPSPAAHAWSVETEAPIVLSITRASPNPTDLASVDFTVTFSEPVTGVDGSGPDFDDFTLTTSAGISNASVTAVNGSDETYTVTVATGSVNGTLRLDVVGGGNIQDAANNPLAGGFTTGEVYSLIKTATFTDVPLSHWASRFIEPLYYNGITGGCSTNPLMYCPDATVTRAEMAVFLLVAKHGTGYTPPPATGLFNDVPASNGFASWIEQLYNEGITGGCGGGNYCPNSPVTREQMAVFLLMAKHGTGYTPPAATGIFNDVPADYPFAPWIEALAAEGITGGCGGGNFCPTGTVTRAQMAVFLVAAFNLP